MDNTQRHAFSCRVKDHADVRGRENPALQHLLLPENSLRPTAVVSRFATRWAALFVIFIAPIWSNENNKGRLRNRLILKHFLFRLDQSEKFGETKMAANGRLGLDEVDQSWDFAFSQKASRRK